MGSASVSSREKLDQMLHDGRITQEEYQRLSQVMAGSSEQLDADQAAHSERGRVCKSWERGVIGGLCAGYAEYFHTDPLTVRVFLLVACVVLSAVGGAGLALIPLYFAFCLFVPWDDQEKAQAFAASGNPRLFVILVASLFIALPALHAFLLLPRLELIYANMGVSVWSGEFQQTWAGRAIDAASEYRHWLQFNDGAFFIGAAIAALFALCAGVVYTTLCRARVRKYYAVAMIAVGCAWVVFLVVGALYPLVTILEPV